MIYAELRNFLTMASSVETVAVFDEAVAVMDKYGLPGYMAAFDEVVGLDPDYSDLGLMDALNVCLRDTLAHLLSIQGLQMNEQVLTSQMTQVLDALYMLPDYEDQAQISGILEAEYSESETAAELLSLLMMQSSDEIIAYFASVDESFTESLILRIDLRSGDEQPVENDIAQYVKVYHVFKAVVGNKAVYSDTVLNEPAAVGMPYATYIELYKAHDMIPHEVEAIANDLVGLAFLASDAYQSPLIAVRKHLNDLFGDMTQITKVNIAASNLIMEVSHAQA